MCTTPLPPSDADRQLIALLDRVAGQDALALKTLYDQTASRLYGVALRVLGKTEWAEDALQDGFLTIWRTANQYQHSLSPPLAWMGLIVRSRSLDLLRKLKSERVADTQELDDTLADQLASDEPTPQDLQHTSQQAQALHGCLSQLEVKQRQLVTLAYMRDLSHSEMAAELHLPLGTVKGWIRRGLERLRQCMAQFA